MSFVCNKTAVADPRLNFGGMEWAKLQKGHTFVTKLAKYSAKQREITAIGEGQMHPLPPPSPVNATVRRRQHTYVLRRLNAYFR